MFKVQISNIILEDPTLTNHAFYLYVHLKLNAHGDTKYVDFTQCLLETLKWKDKKTLKKYLQELRDRGYISVNLRPNIYGTESLPAHQPIRISILHNSLTDNYTQIEKSVLLKVQSVAQKVDFYKRDEQGEFKLVAIYDQKELATRQFYIIQKNFIMKDNIPLFLPYKEFARITHANTKLIKAINDNLCKNKLIKIIQGIPFNKGNRRSTNRYIPTQSSCT